MVSARLVLTQRQTLDQRAVYVVVVVLENVLAGVIEDDGVDGKLLEVVLVAQLNQEGCNLVARGLRRRLCAE